MVLSTDHLISVSTEPSTTHHTVEVSPRVDLLRPINLTCTAEGPTQANYQWLKDGVVIPGETRQHLYIEAVVPEDRGNYTCVAVRAESQGTSLPTSLKISGESYLEQHLLSALIVKFSCVHIRCFPVHYFSSADSQ